MANFQLQIPTPCSEKWEHMQPTGKGSFCSSCQKEVVDFTTMSDEHLKDYFSQKKGRGSTCGRFRIEQLNKNYSSYEVNSSVWKRWMLAVLMGTGLPAGVYGQTEPQTKPDTLQVPTTANAPASEEEKVQKKQTPPTFEELRGVVLDSVTREPLPGVAIRLVGTNIGLVTDIDGNFVLKNGMVQNSDSVLFTYVGYKSQTISLQELKGNSLVFMAEDMEVLSEAVFMGGYHTVRWYSPRRLWWGIKSIFQ